MRIVQIIDTLNSGGAERMAVNYANALVEKIEFSGLIATRKEGDLTKQISNKVNYFFLNKNFTVDISALFKLYKYCKQNNITHIHAHSSSFFLAILVKIFLHKIKIIWHIHNGNFINISKNNLYLYKFLASFTFKIIVVNRDTNNWILKKISKNCIYLENFSNTIIYEKNTMLLGKNGKKILILANLKNPKNHIYLMKIAKKIIHQFQDWSFHLVGKDFYDDYSNELKNYINAEKLNNNIFIYNSKQDISYIISQATICILTSEYEGLPVALIEYGMHKKPVVSTAVGEIPNIIKNKENGLLVPVNDINQFVNSLKYLIENESKRNLISENFYQTILKNYSEEVIISKYLNLFN